MERQTARYDSALAELAEHAELQAFQGAAGFNAWQRLEALVAKLRAIYDLYELEGDVAPVRQAIEAYFRDLTTHQLRPDPWVTSYLTRFLEDMAPERLTLTIDTSLAAPPPVSVWPAGILAVSPEELLALQEALQERSRQH